MKERENDESSFVHAELEVDVRLPVRCPVCRRHDFGTQGHNWSSIFEFEFIYMKVIIEATRS